MKRMLTQKDAASYCGLSIAEVAAITGQTYRIVEHYAAEVNRRKLGQSAVVKLEAHRNKSA